MGLWRGVLVGFFVEGKGGEGEEKGKEMQGRSGKYRSLVPLLASSGRFSACTSPDISRLAFRSPLRRGGRGRTLDELLIVALLRGREVGRRAEVEHRAEACFGAVRVRDAGEVRVREYELSAAAVGVWEEGDLDGGRRELRVVGFVE